MKYLMRVTLVMFFILNFSSGALYSQKPTVYVATLSTGHYHTGMVIPLSALFFKNVDGDTAWEYMGRPNNRIFHFDLHEKSKGKYIAMATHTGIHQSFDFGKTWKVTTGWRITEANCVKFDPRDQKIIYCSSPYGFYKSVDNGKTWQKHIKGLNSIDAQFVSSFIIDIKNPDVLYASTEDVVYKSIDAGLSWQKLGLRVRHIRVIVQHPQKPEILVAGTEDNGIYFSYDGGKTWQKNDTGILGSAFYTIAFDPSNPDIVYAGGFQTGVYKSTDGGKKWKQHFKGLDLLDIHAIAVDPNNSNRVFAGTMGKGVYQSDDGGKTWRFIGIDNGFVYDIKIINW